MLGIRCSSCGVAGGYFFTQHAIKPSISFPQATAGTECTRVQLCLCRKLSRRALSLADTSCKAGGLQVVGCRRTRYTWGEADRTNKLPPPLSGWPLDWLGQLQMPTLSFKA